MFVLVLFFCSIQTQKAPSALGKDTKRVLMFVEGDATWDIIRCLKKIIQCDTAVKERLSPLSSSLQLSLEPNLIRHVWNFTRLILFQGRRSGAVASTVASLQEGCRFESDEAFLCRDCMFSLSPCAVWVL